MKKIITMTMMLSGVVAFAQTGKVGINTDKPRATMDIVGKPITNTDKTISRGVIFPHISDVQKAEFTDKTEGLMIWNTTKKCVDVWNGTTWQCLGEVTNSTPQFTWGCEEVIKEELLPTFSSAGHFNDNGTGGLPRCPRDMHPYATSTSNEYPKTRRRITFANTDISGTTIQNSQQIECYIDMGGMSNENDLGRYTIKTTTINTCNRL